MFKKIKKLLLTVFFFNFLFISIQPMMVEDPLFSQRPCFMGCDGFDLTEESLIKYDSEDIEKIKQAQSYLKSYLQQNEFNQTKRYVVYCYSCILRAILKTDLAFVSSLINWSRNLEILYIILNKTNSGQEISFLNYACGMLPEKSSLVDIINTLINIGVDPNIQNSRGEFPLLTAAFLGHFRIVTKLLDHSADPNLQDNCGNTALHKVVESPYLSWVEIVQILLENGAYPTIRNKCGKTPLQIILENLNDDIFKMFFTQNIEEVSRAIATDVSSYLGYFEMMFLILDTDYILEELINLDFLEQKLSSVLEREIEQKDFYSFLDALKNYPVTFVLLSNKYNILPDMVNVDSLYIDSVYIGLLRTLFKEFYTFNI